MRRIKIVRKNTWVDMTAFVDMSFLILSFFMLAAKFKPQEAIPILTPSSVTAELIQEKDSFIVLVEGSGRVFIQLDPEVRGRVISNLNETQGLKLSTSEVKKFIAHESIGVSFNQLKPFLSLSLEEQKKINQKGVPIDLEGGELSSWVKSTKFVTSGKKINWFIKGAKKTPYSVFRKVLKALKSNELNRFLLITEPKSTSHENPYL